MEEKTVAQMQAELRDFYFKKVKPNLDWMNKQRGRKRLGTIAVMFIVFGVGILFSLSSLVINEVPFGLFAGVGFILTGCIILYFNKGTVKSSSKYFDINGEHDFKDKFMPEFASIFGDLKWEDSARTDKNVDLYKYHQQHIMNPFYVGACGDRFTGSYRGVSFLIQELDTSKNSLQGIFNALLIAPFAIGCGCAFFLVSIWIVMPIATWIGKLCHNDTVTGIIVTAYVLGLPLFGLVKYFSQPGFRGVFIEFDMNKNFEGHTFVLERAKTSNCIKFDHSKFEEVKLEDPEFMEKYKIYTTNQVEARYVLTTAFIERFKNMKVAFRAKYIRAAFKDGKITIAIDAGRDLFQMANLNTDTDSNTFVEIFNEIMSIRELINALKLNEKIGL